MMKLLFKLTGLVLIAGVVSAMMSFGTGALFGMTCLSSAMSPTYEPGSTLVFRKCTGVTDLPLGGVVLYEPSGSKEEVGVEPTGLGRITKMHVTAFGVEELWIEVDNAGPARDSRVFGYVPRSVVKGVLLVGVPKWETVSSALGF